MNLEGLELAARFSYQCPRTKQLEINRLLLGFIRNGTNQDAVEQELQRLLSFGYYQIIARRNKIDDPFDKRVIWAYWIGDDELTEVVTEDGKSIFLFHNFTALESIHRTPDANPDYCKMSAARVKEIEGDKISVFHRPLIQQEDNKFTWSKKSETLKIDKGFVGDVVKEEWIAYHRGIGRLPLLEEEALSVIKRTEEAINLFNESSE